MGVVLQYIPVDWGLPVVEFGLLTDTRRLKMHFNDSENLIIYCLECTLFCTNFFIIDYIEWDWWQIVSHLFNNKFILT